MVIIVVDEKDEFVKTLESIKKSTESVRKTFQKISESIPKIELPEFHIPDVSKLESVDITKERNNWERHEELMGIQDTSLKVQEKILTEQKSTSNMTCIILILTFVILIISIATMLS